MKKRSIMIAFAAVLMMMTMVGCNKPEDKPKVEMEHNTLVCGIYDPLNNMPWLKQYCQDIQTRKDLSFVSVDLLYETDTLTHEDVFYFASNIVKKEEKMKTFREYRDCSGVLVAEFTLETDVCKPSDEFLKWTNGKYFRGEIFRCTW